MNRKQINAVFEQVRNATNWMGPIDAEINEKDRYEVETAIIATTSTMPRFTEVGRGKLRVQAEGYSAGPLRDLCPICGDTQCECAEAVQRRVA